MLVQQNNLLTYFQKSFNYIKDYILYKYDNSKYYAIKLIIDSSIEKIPIIKNIFSKYSKSQLLFTFFCSNVINNMFYNKDNIIPSYRLFIYKLGTWIVNHDTCIPIMGNKEFLHNSNDISCMNDIIRLLYRSVIKLTKLYSKLALITILYKFYTKKELKINNQIIQIFKSTSFLTLFAFIYRIIICGSFNLKSQHHILTSQFATVLGSFTFQLESTNRQKIINKFLTSLYLHDTTSQIGLTNKFAWNLIFIVGLLYSIKLRSVKNTILTLLF